MHSSFGRADALFVIAMKDELISCDLNMQFTKTPTSLCGDAVTLLRRFGDFCVQRRNFPLSFILSLIFVAPLWA